MLHVLVAALEQERAASPMMRTTEVPPAAGQVPTGMPKLGNGGVKLSKYGLCCRWAPGQQYRLGVEVLLGLPGFPRGKSD